MATVVWKNGEWWLESDDFDDLQPLGIPSDATLGDAVRAAKDQGYTEVSIRSEPN